MNRKISLDQIGYTLGYSDPHDNSDENNAERLARLKRLMHQVIQCRLTERQKEMLVLYYFEHKSMPEIAQMLEVNKSTVSRTLNRAQNNIRKYLEFYMLR